MNIETTMKFRDAVRALQQRPTREDLADALGASPYTVKSWMLPPDSDAARNPADGWRPVLARLIREEAERLKALAATVEGGA